jgi:predicted amidohydrolase
MARHLITASAQMGPVSKSETRKDTVARLMAMMREAHGRGAKLVVFTEMALTTFFPRWLIEDVAELDSYYETALLNHCLTSRQSWGSVFIWATLNLWSKAG